MTPNISNNSLYHSCSSSMIDDRELTTSISSNSSFSSRSSVASRSSITSYNGSIGVTAPTIFSKLKYKLANFVVATKNIYDRIVFSLDISYTKLITSISTLCSKLANSIEKHYNNSPVLQAFVDQFLIKLFLLAITLALGITITV